MAAPGVVFLILLTLKLLGVVTISWWWVILTPIILWLAIFVVLFIWILLVT